MGRKVAGELAIQLVRGARVYSLALLGQKLILAQHLHALSAQLKRVVGGGGPNGGVIERKPPSQDVHRPGAGPLGHLKIAGDAERSFLQTHAYQLHAIIGLDDDTGYAGPRIDPVNLDLLLAQVVSQPLKPSLSARGGHGIGRYVGLGAGERLFGGNNRATKTTLLLDPISQQDDQIVESEDGPTRPDTHLAAFEV